MIVDVHVHLGYDQVYDIDFTEANLLGGVERWGVDLSLVQPATCVFLDEVIAQHDAIAALVAQHPGMMAGIANPNPHLPEEVYRREAARCVRELGFVGLKIQTQGHGVGIGSRAAQKVYDAAGELGVPVMLHTGAVHAMVAPIGALAVAQARPQLPIVLAHAGANGNGPEAMAVALRCPNVYLETTWAPVGFVRDAVRRLGARRVMFGSDQPANIGVELAKFQALDLPDADLERCLSGTAREVFKI